MKTSINILSVTCTIFSIVGVIAGIYQGRIEAIIISIGFLFIAKGFKQTSKEVEL